MAISPAPFAPCSAQTEHFTPTTLVLRELSATSTPHLSQAAGTNLPSAPFWPPDSSKTRAICRKRLTFCKGKQRSQSCTASLGPPSSFSGLHWEGTTGSISFSMKEQWVHSMPGWQKSHQSLVGAQLPSQLCRHWLTRAFGLLWVIFLKFNQRAPKCKAVEGTTIHL